MGGPLWVCRLVRHEGRTRHQIDARCARTEEAAAAFADELRSLHRDERGAVIVVEPSFMAVEP